MKYQPSNILDKSLKNSFPGVYFDSSNARKYFTEEAKPMVHEEHGLLSQFFINPADATA